MTPPPSSGSDEIKGEGLHYQTVLKSGVADGGDDGAAAAEGFFELANASLVRFTVEEAGRGARITGMTTGSTEDTRKGGNGGSSGVGGGGVELLVEQDQSLHNSCGGIVWESAFCLAGYLRRCVRRRCEEPPISRAGGFEACSVLEVGAGCGLLGMSMAVMGARRVVLTDHPDAMPLLRRNVRRNAKALRGDNGDDDDGNDRDGGDLSLIHI